MAFAALFEPRGGVGLGNGAVSGDPAGLGSQHRAGLSLSGVKLHSKGKERPRTKSIVPRFLKVAAVIRRLFPPAVHFRVWVCVVCKFQALRTDMPNEASGIVMVGWLLAHAFLVSHLPFINTHDPIIMSLVGYGVQQVNKYTSRIMRLLTVTQTTDITVY